MMHRWGPNQKEMAAMVKYLETQNIEIKTHPVVSDQICCNLKDFVTQIQ